MNKKGDDINKSIQVAQSKAKDDPEETGRLKYWDIVVLLTPWLSPDQVRETFVESLEMTKRETSNTKLRISTLKLLSLFIIPLL